MRPTLLALLAAAAASTAAADPGTLTRATTLLQNPYSDAPTVVDMAAGASVNVEERQGGWYRVKTADKITGWTRMTSVRFADKKSASGASQVVGLIESGRSGATGATATTGVRGLDENDLERAQPNTAELDSMNRYSATPQQASQYAAALGLHTASFPLKAGDQP